MKVQLGANWKTAAFTDAEADVIGKGRVVQENSPQGPKLWKLVKNGSSTVPITENKIVQITSQSANGVTMKGTLAEQLFGGLRADGADPIEDTLEATARVWGFVQILGYFDNGMFGDTATAIQAGKGIVADDDADLGNMGGVIDTSLMSGDDAADKVAVEAALASAAGVFARAVAASGGVADEAVAGTIFRNGWGQYCAND